MLDAFRAFCKTRFCNHTGTCPLFAFILIALVAALKTALRCRARATLWELVYEKYLYRKQRVGRFADVLKNLPAYAPGSYKSTPCSYKNVCSYTLTTAGVNSPRLAPVPHRRAPLPQPAASVVLAKSANGKPQTPPKLK